MVIATTHMNFKFRESPWWESDIQQIVALLLYMYLQVEHQLGQVVISFLPASRPRQMWVGTIIHYFITSQNNYIEWDISLSIVDTMWATACKKNNRGSV